jgi:hypothetical protein
VGQSPWLVTPLVVVSWTSCPDCTSGRPQRPFAGVAVHSGAIFGWCLGGASQPFGSASAPATERGARCPASRRPRVAPIRDAGDAAEPLQLVDPKPPRRWTVLEDGESRAERPWKHRAQARWKRRACVTDLYVEEDPEVERSRQAAADASSGERSKEHLREQRFARIVAEAVKQRRGSNGERGSPTVNGQDASPSRLERSSQAGEIQSRKEELSGR